MHVFLKMSTLNRALIYHAFLFFPSYENIYKLIEKKTKIITKTTTDNPETMSHVVTSVRVSKSIVFFVFLSYVFTISAHKD